MKTFLRIVLILLSFQSLHSQNIENNFENQACDEQPKSEIKILCWNIFMLPFLSKGQHDRVSPISDQLQGSDYDVLVLQEVFLERVKSKLIKSLSACYPYYVGPPGHDKLITQDGGVMIFSKYPIVNQAIIEYNSGCMDADCYCMKGAVLVEIEKDGKKFQVIGTHLQSMESDEAQVIRDKQFTEMYDKLIIPYQKEEIPQFIVGDLNTESHMKMRYRTMLTLLDAKDSRHHKMDHENKPKEPTWTEENKFNGGKKGRAVTLDYVLYRTNKAWVHIKHSAVKIFRAPWHQENDDLSDHYAVETTIELK